MAKRARTNASLAHNAARNGNEARVIHESLRRAGNNRNLHGIIHEKLIVDKINRDPHNLIRGVRASLTRNPRAKTVDIVVKQGKKVIQRIQAKDTASSISRTVSKIESGQYRSARILGTKETARKIAPKLTKKGITKTVKSSKISSQTTKTLASKAGVNGMKGISKACGTAAKGAAITGGAVSGGIALVKGINDFVAGKRTAGAVAQDVARETAGGAISAAGASAAATAGGAAVASALATAGVTGAGAVAATVAAPVVIALGVGYGIKTLWDWIW